MIENSEICIIELLIKMKNTTQQPLKQKWTGLTDKIGKFHLAYKGQHAWFLLLGFLLF